jgi:hypothetical protein
MSVRPLRPAGSGLPRVTPRSPSSTPSGRRSSKRSRRSGAHPLTPSAPRSSGPCGSTGSWLPASWRWRLTAWTSLTRWKSHRCACRAPRRWQQRSSTRCSPAGGFPGTLLTSRATTRPSSGPPPGGGAPRPPAPCLGLTGSIRSSCGGPGTPGPARHRSGRPETEAMPSGFGVRQTGLVDTMADAVRSPTLRLLFTLLGKSQMAQNAGARALGRGSPQVGRCGRWGSNPHGLAASAF